MRSAALLLELIILLPIALVRPFVGVLLWSWISFQNPHRMVWGLAADVPWAAIIFGATMIGCIIAREPKRLPLNAMTVLITLFMIMITITTFTALAPMDLVLKKWEFVMKVFFFLLVTAALLTSKERIHALVWIMVLALVYFGIKGGGGSILRGGSARVLGPPDTMIMDNNHLAAALLVTLPLINYLRLQSRHYIVRLGLTGAMGLTFFAIIGSYSRGALLGLMAVTVLLWLRSRRKVVLGIALCAILVMAVSFMPQEWYERMATIETYQADTSATTRLMMWRNAWVLAVARPLTGIGFGGTYTPDVVERYIPGAPARAVHSIWFELLAEHGFPTFFIWVGMIIAGVVYSQRIIAAATGMSGLEWACDLARMSQASIIAFVTAGTFLSLSYWDFFFTLLVVVAATNDHVKVILRQSTIQQPGRAAGMPARLPLAQRSPQLAATLRRGPDRRATLGEAG